MPIGWGSYSTPPGVTNTATPLAEGTLPPFPENDAVVGDDKQLTPAWRRWFTKHRSWMTDRGAYIPTDLAYSGMGASAALSGPTIHWWKQGNIVQIYLNTEVGNVTVGGGSCTIRPVPFDPTIKTLTMSAYARPVFTMACQIFNGTVWNSCPSYVLNDKAASTGTKLVILNIPVNASLIHVNGTYITDN